jgi:hypothetical protein
MAPPGWPEFAFSTIAADRIRMLSAALFVTELLIVILFEMIVKNYGNNNLV